MSERVLGFSKLRGVDFTKWQCRQWNFFLKMRWQNEFVRGWD